MNGVLLDVIASRAFQTGSFALRLDLDNLADVTLLTGSDGGGIYADVVSVISGGEFFARKHLTAPKYDAFAIPVGAAMSTGLFDWVSGSWGATPAKRSGAVLAVDADFKIRSEAEFFNALVAETRIPPLDASSKQTGYLTVQFQPELIDVRKGTGKLQVSLAKNKLWRTSNFRLEIDNLDCSKVSRIDALTIRRPLTIAASGSGGLTLIPGKIEFPNLTISLSTSSAGSWFDWHKSFVIDGNNSDNFERAGRIRFLAHDFKTELSRIELHHLGIVRVARSVNHSSLVSAELYCEQMVLSPPVNP